MIDPSKFSLLSQRKRARLRIRIYREKKAAHLWQWPPSAQKTLATMSGANKLMHAPVKRFPAPTSLKCQSLVIFLALPFFFSFSTFFLFFPKEFAIFTPKTFLPRGPPYFSSSLASYDVFCSQQVEAFRVHGKKNLDGSYRVVERFSVTSFFVFWTFLRSFLGTLAQQCFFF